MNDRIINHVDFLLQDAPRTKRIEELREELIAGCLDKYGDLTAQGVSPEDAYNRVISGIGDVHELIGDLLASDQQNPFNPEQIQRHKQKRTMLIVLSIGLYTIGMCMFFLCAAISMEEIGLFMFFLCAGAGTAVLVYGLTSTEVKYIKQEDTIVEEVKVQMAKGGRGSRENKLMGAASSSLWALGVFVFMFIGLFFDLWHPGWLIFPFCAFLQTLLAILFADPAHRSGKVTASIYTGATVLFLSISFITGYWAVTWTVFLLAVVVQQILKLVKVWREDN